MSEHIGGDVALYYDDDRALLTIFIGRATLTMTLPQWDALNLAANRAIMVGVNA